ncbi:hypothetical protein A9Q96_16950 [Rhodobacterales bacterium 52_120_T64]|nr:hypothetical protein A9Q96_16950 [Rhodobacterales bacterium 52_120_T64]
MDLTILLGSFALLMIIGIPVAFCFLTSAIIYMWSSDLPLAMTAQQMSSGVRGYTLVAIPLYVLAGELMNSGGITRRIFDFANAMVGHVKGGLGHVNVVASVIFAGASGSSSADAAGLGRIEIKSMLDKGYRPEFAASITAVSSTIGPIIPPSIHLVLYGALAEVGIDYLFLAGIVPGFIMAACMMAMIYFLVVTGREPCPTQPKASPRERLRYFGRAIFPASAPVIIVGGILSGIFTPTEAGAVAVGYALILGLIYGDLTLASLKEAMVRSVKSTAMVMFILATAKVFALGITLEQVPELLAVALFSLTENVTVLILLVLIALLILGTFESASANLVIVTPVLLPMAPSLGLDPVHMGVVVVLALMIGVITPPVGISLFIVSDIAGVSFGKVVRNVLPYIFALIVALLLVTFLPDLVLFLPRVFGYAG